jgi:GNAT superfamily N-acetyltransferase
MARGKQQMLIRKATAGDAQACWDLRNRAILEGCSGYYDAGDLRIWTDGTLTESFTGIVDAHFYVAELAGEIIGSAMLDAPNAQLEALFVAPRAMGTGAGKALLKHIETLATLQGLTRLRLESTLNAAPFYRANGFGGEGKEETSIYHSPRGIVLDCVVMYKDLVCVDSSGAPNA